MKIKMTKDELLFVKGAYTEFSPLSLLGNLSGTVENSDMSGLNAQGIIVDNVISEEANRLFWQLNTAVKMTRNRLMTPLGVMERMTYETSDEVMVSVVQTDSGFIIEEPANMDGPLAMYMDMFGRSGVIKGNMACELSQNEALVMASVMDLRIEQALSVLLNQWEAPVPQLTSEVLKAYMGKEEKHNRLMPLIKALTGAEPEAISSVEDQVEAIAGKEWLSVDGDVIRLEDQIENFCDGLTVFNSIMNVETFLEGEESIFNEKTMIVYGGPMSILMLSRTEEGVLMSAITGKDLMEILI